MLLEPLTGVCHGKVTERHTKKDWALFIRDLVDKYFPEADTITLVMDNLSTHKKAALYEVFPPQEAKRIADKLDIHFTPKHDSWLNMAEIGLNVLLRQCLDRRIPSIQQVGKDVKAWLKARKEHPPVVNWRFTTDNARIKLKRLYPALQAS